MKNTNVKLAVTNATNALTRGKRGQVRVTLTALRKVGKAQWPIIAGMPGVKVAA